MRLYGQTGTISAMERDATTAAAAIPHRTVKRVDHDGKPWPAGPWDNEPDRVEFRTEAGLPAIILRNFSGALCGYVGVEPGHPWHGSTHREAGADDDIEVHGGITYSNECAGEVCHVPAPGEPEHLWWLGFDANHGGDRAPGDSFARPERDVYRTIDYMRAECESLARQAKSIAP